MKTSAVFIKCMNLTDVYFVGYWSKTIVTRYQQPIEVKNTHQHEVKIQVEEQLPRSENDKIKVCLFAFFCLNMLGVVFRLCFQSFLQFYIALIGQESNMVL